MTLREAVFYFYFMLARQRQRQILLMLETSSSLRTIELAKYFDVTDETIRRDLEILDAENKLIRTHGGALRIEKRMAELPLQKRLNENRTAKQEIAKKAASLVKESDTIFLDASSTVLTLAETLPDIKISVITNAHDCVVPLMAKNNIDVITTGGKLDRFSHSYCGISAFSLMKRFSIDKAFFSCNGLDLERGASEAAEIHAEFKENTLSICREKILLCDSSKLGVQSLRFFCELNNIDTVITDSNADKTFIAKLTELGINVL